MTRMNVVMECLQRVCLAVRDRAHREKGASMVEYAILVAIIAGVVLAASTFLGGQISTLMDGITLTT